MALAARTSLSWENSGFLLSYLTLRTPPHTHGNPCLASSDPQGLSKPSLFVASIPSSAPGNQDVGSPFPPPQLDQPLKPHNTPLTFTPTPLFLRLTFLEQFRFRVNLRQRCRTVPFACHMHSLPIINIPHHGGTFVTSDEPTLAHRYCSKSVISLRVHSDVEHSTDLDKCMITCIHPCILRVFPPPQRPFVLHCSSLPPI